MATVYLALGSNIGNSRQYIDKAVELLGAWVHDIRQAPIYLSKATGYTDQPDFLNTAIRGTTDVDPEELLEFVKDVEKKTGRKLSFRFGPRQIDIDIILYDDRIIKTDELTIPHRALISRDFVLRPLQDLDPALKDPATGKTVKQLLEAIKPANRSIIHRID